MSKIVDDGNFHTALENRKPVDIEVYEGFPATCKVDLRGMEPPLIMQFRYKSKSDVVMYGSYRNTEPSPSTNFDMKYDKKPNKIKITVPGGGFKSS